MNFKTVDKVSEQIEAMKTAEQLRAPQRVLLNSFFNGEAPWTVEEAKQNRILINFNNKQGCRLLHEARNQYHNAFSKRSTYFKVTLPDCKEELRPDYETVITTRINLPMKKSLPWFYTQDEVWGGVCLHGVSAKHWPDADAWRPDFIGIQDILMPTDTTLGMENLQCFALRRKMSPGKLFKKTLWRGENVDPGWNLKAVKRLLDEYKDLNSNPNNYDWANNPEQMMEVVKQQSGMYYDTDMSPVIWLWDFYHLEHGDNEDQAAGWYRSIILDKDCVAGRQGDQNNPVQFIYDKNTPFASSLGEFIHFQFGDGNNVPPFMYHSLRSLAYLTYELVWTMNRLQCQFTQHVFEQLMLLLRITDPSDRARLEKIVLTPPYGILPDGLNIIAGNERYHADANLIETLLSQYKQQIGETSAAYTQQLDTGTAKERTKFEVQALLAQTSALMSSMLNRAYLQETFAYREIARRFTLKNTHDFDVKKFQASVIAQGVPAKWIDAERWDIETEQVLGSGNRSMELAEATELFQNRAAFDPDGQREITHDFAIALTQNPAKAARLAGLGKGPKVTDSIHDAEQSFGSLMAGVDMQIRDGFSHIQQVETLLRCLGQEIEKIMKSGGVGTPDDVNGLQNTAKFIAKHLQIMGADEKLAPQAKTFANNLKDLMNLVKAMAQRQQEMARKAAAQPGQGDQADAQAKAQATLMQTQAKIQAGNASTQAKLQQGEQKHQQKLAHKEQDHALDLRLKAIESQLDGVIKSLEASRKAAQPKTSSPAP